jgi:hypothetical protein
MKILLHNYSSELSSEPAYLYHALNQCGVNVGIWADPNMSAFDVFDLFSPDVFVTHVENLSPDIVKYLQQNGKIELVLNATTMSDSQFSNMELFLKEKSLTVPLVFSNSLSFKPRPKTSLNLQQLLPAFDLFARLQRQVDPSILPLCKEVIVSQKYGKVLKEFLLQESLTDAVDNKKINYHLAQFTNGEKSEDFDIRANILSLQALFDMYQTISIAGPADFCLSQIFFDSAINAREMSIIADDKDNFHKGLDEIFTDTNLQSNNRDEIKAEIKKQVKQRHTPFHRAATLLKHLKNKDAMAKVEKFKESLPELLKDI